MCAKNIRTFGIAYTKDPSAAEEVLDSAVVLVRNTTMLGPLLVNERWIFVCGARGSGNETSFGVAWDATPFVGVVCAIFFWWTVEV